jgi:hypothetical protein
MVKEMLSWVIGMIMSLDKNYNFIGLIIRMKLGFKGCQLGLVNSLEIMVYWVN